MQQEASLHLLGSEPLAGYFQELVAAAAIGESALAVAGHEIARDVPFPAEALGRLLHVLPVPDRARIAADPEPAGLSIRELASIVVAHLHLEAGDDRPQRARLHLSGAVRDEDVPHLGRAQPV